MLILGSHCETPFRLDVYILGAAKEQEEGFNQQAS